MRTLLIGAALAAIAVPAQARDARQGATLTAREAADRAAHKRWDKRPRLDAPLPDPRATPPATPETPDTPARPPFEPYRPPTMTTNPAPYTNPSGSLGTAPDWSSPTPAGPTLP